MKSAMRENKEEVWRVLEELALARMGKEDLPAEVAVSSLARSLGKRQCRAREEKASRPGGKSLVCSEVSNNPSG